MCVRNGPLARGAPMSAAALQSLLFVPGTRPERFAKALSSGADIVCIDLEDAVPPAEKDSAREAALAALGDPRLALRINGVPTLAGLADLVALGRAGVRPPLLLVPKVEDAAEIGVIRGALGGAGAFIVPLIETARGLRAAPDIAREPGVAALMFGGGDFAAELGVELAWEPLLHARAALLLAAAEAGVPAIDVPWIALDDAHGLETEARRAKALGFAAKAAIHPAQIGPIHAVFRPTEAEIADAEEALAAFDAAGGTAVRHKGRMLEAPIVRRHQQTLALKGLINA